MGPVVPVGVGVGAGAGVGAGGQSPSQSLHLNLPGVGVGAGLREGPSGGLTHPGKRDSIAMLDDVGGEWEREGLGRGLEERLEILVGGSAKVAG